MKTHGIFCYFIGALAALLIAFGDCAVALLACHPRGNYGLPLLLGMTMAQSTNAFWWPSSSTTENEGQATNEEQAIKVETPLPDEDEKDTTLDADKEAAHFQENQQPEAKKTNGEQMNNVRTHRTENDNASSEVGEQQQHQVTEDVQVSEQNEQREEEEEEEVEEEIDEEEAVEEEEDREYEGEEEEEEEEIYEEEEVEEEEDENTIQAWFHNTLKRAIELFYVDSETGEKHPAAPYGEHIVKSDHMVGVTTGHGHVFHAYPLGGDTTGEPIQTFEINADSVNEEDGSLTFRIEL